MLEDLVRFEPPRIRQDKLIEGDWQEELMTSCDIEIDEVQFKVEAHTLAAKESTALMMSSQ